MPAVQFISSLHSVRLPSLSQMLHSSFSHFPSDILSPLRPVSTNTFASVLFSLSAFFPPCCILLILFTLFLNGLSVEGGEEIESTREHGREREREKERTFMANTEPALIIYPDLQSQANHSRSKESKKETAAVGLQGF